MYLNIITFIQHRKPKQRGVIFLFLVNDYDGDKPPERPPKPVNKDKTVDMDSFLTLDVGDEPFTLTINHVKDLPLNSVVSMSVEHLKFIE